MTRFDMPELKDSADSNLSLTDARLQNVLDMKRYGDAIVKLEGLSATPEWFESKIEGTKED